MKREYFYKDQNKVVRPYHYCSECGKQFNDEEFKAGLIVNVGSTTTPIKYCAKICLQIKFPPPSEDSKKKGTTLTELPEDPEEELVKEPD